MLTNQPLGQYFRSPEFFKYFLNIVGDIHYTLPGVFAHNPSDVVNAQLWTIPFELKCYAALTGMAIIGLYRRRALMLAATCLIIFATILYVTLNPVEIVDVWQLLVPTFLLSVCAYLYRDRLPWNPWLFVVSVALAGALVSLNNAFMILAAFPITYLTIWLGLLEPKRDALIRSGDYSYPLYLYSFPIQQALIAVVPWARIWWLNFILALPITFLLAAFSWHLIEKPAQGARRYIYGFENWLRTRSSAKTSGGTEATKPVTLNE
jgi:peptidoglycan/LPS O-acetylase OafA/YrhL